MTASTSPNVWTAQVDQDHGPLPTTLESAYHEILRLRDEVIGLHEIVGTLRGEIELSMAQGHAVGRIEGHLDRDHLVFERDHYRSVAEGLKRTTTWRLGRLVLSPVTFVKQIFGRTEGSES